MYIYVILISVFFNIEDNLNIRNDISLNENSIINSNISNTMTKQIDCHPYAGIIIKTLSGWKCIPKYPSLFGGPAANKIMTVDHTIIEHKEDGSKITYIDTIDSSIVLMDNPETERIIDVKGESHYRFTPNIIYDQYTSNEYVASENLRFHLTKNVCNEFLINDKSNSIPDYKLGKCNCAIGYRQLTPNIYTCVPISYFDDYVTVAKIPCVTTEFSSVNIANSRYNSCPENSKMPFKILNVALDVSRKNGMSKTLAQKINSY